MGAGCGREAKRKGGGERRRLLLDIGVRGGSRHTFHEIAKMLIRKCLTRSARLSYQTLSPYPLISFDSGRNPNQIALT